MLGGGGGDDGLALGLESLIELGGLAALGLLLGGDDEELEEDDESLLEFEGPAVALGLPLRGDNTAEAEEAAGDRGTSLNVDGLAVALGLLLGGDDEELEEDDEVLLEFGSGSSSQGRQYN